MRATFSDKLDPGSPRLERGHRSFTLESDAVDWIAEIRAHLEGFSAREGDERRGRTVGGATGRPAEPA